MRNSYYDIHGLFWLALLHWMEVETVGKLHLI